MFKSELLKDTDQNGDRRDNVEGDFEFRYDIESDSVSDDDDSSINDSEHADI